MSSAAQPFFDQSVDWVRRGAVRQALDSLLQALAADPAHAPSHDAAARICRLLGAQQDAELFGALAEHPDDAQALFALAWRLVDQHRPEVAVALLERCLALEDHPVTRRELAFARLQARDFRGCLATVAPLAEHDDLADAERLEIHLLCAEAALYAGRRPLAQDLLARAEELLPDEVQTQRLDALHGLMGRSLHWTSLSALGLREWHHIQHAGVILKTAGGYFEDQSRHGRFGVLHLRADMVAFLLQRLAQLLETWDLVPQVVAPASAIAAPLAHALGQRLGAAVVQEREELADRAERPTLLVAASAGEFAPLASELSRHREELRLFALNLDWSQDLPLCPEVVGVLAQRALLPWEEQVGLAPATGQGRQIPADERAPELVGAELVELMGQLPDDGGEARAKFEGFYLPLKEELLLGNEERYPHRRAFTALSPCGAEEE